MSTNYYADVTHCSRCHGLDPGCRDWETLHVGKQSAGWFFALHVIPEHSLDSWEAWLTLLRKPTMATPHVRKLYSEYGGITLAELRQLVEQPVKPCRRSTSYCVGEGPTWDLVSGDFS